MSEATESLKALAARIHEAYWQAGHAGMALFAPFKEAMLAHGFLDWTRFHLQHYHASYCWEMLLSCPFLWVGRDPRIWADLLRQNAPRPGLPKIPDPLGHHADIVFLHRFAGVDAIAFLVADPRCAAADKAHVVAYFRYFWHHLIASEADREDLDGEYFVPAADLLALQRQLVADCGFLPAAQTPEGVQQRLAECGARI